MKNSVTCPALLLLAFVTIMFAGCGGSGGGTSAGVGISTSSLPAGTTATAYSQTLTATGGTAPYTWALASGSSLPAGMSLNASGVISGTPTASGTFTFSVTVTDSSNPPLTVTQQLSITINAVGISTTSLPAATVGTAYSQTLAATGGTPPYTWSISAGTLPAGLSLAPATGVISGTPTTAGTSNITVTVSDSSSPAATASQTMAISVNATAAPLAITTSSLPDATFGTSYSQALVAGGGTGPYTWVIISGGLPNGLSLNSSGTISGTVLTTAGSSFSVMVTDSASNVVTGSLTLNVSISANVAAGKTIYDGKCYGCHSLGIYDTTGAFDLSGLGAHISTLFQGSHNSITLTSTQISNLISFVNLF